MGRGDSRSRARTRRFSNRVSLDLTSMPPPNDYYVGCRVKVTGVAHRANEPTVVLGKLTPEGEIVVDCIPYR